MYKTIIIVTLQRYIAIRYHINILSKLPKWQQFTEIYHFEPSCNTTIIIISVGVVMIVTLSEHFLDGLFLLINEVKEVNNNLGTMNAWWFWGRRSNILLSLFEASVLANHSQKKQRKCNKWDNAAWEIQTPKANQVKLVRLGVACPIFSTTHFTEPLLMYLTEISILGEFQNCCRHVIGKRRLSLKSLVCCYKMSGNAKYNIEHK